MQTTLTYRFPQNSIVRQQGVFKKIEEPELFEGFIISDFEGKNFYGFFENETGEIVSEIEKPIVISQSAYCDLATEFIHYLQDLDIGKAVLSRVKQADLKTNQEELFLSFTERYPNAFCFSFQSPSLGNWIGATPETLVKIEDQKGFTMSLAGTKAANDTTPWGEKEIHEQQLVTDFIQNELSAVCESVNLSDRDELIAGPVKHLVHRFEFEINSEKQWELIQNLHPTPAVSGFPRQKALKCIYNFEPHKRLFYAGIIGIKSPTKTHLFVTLRTAQIIENQIFVYVGGGLTQQSSPESEWDETERKSFTILT